MKKIVEKGILGMGVGCFGFVAMLFIASLFAGGADAFFAQKSGSEWLKLAACFIVIAEGFALSSLVYAVERLGLGMRVLIHMTVGTAIYLLTAGAMGWIGSGLGAVAGYLAIALAAAALCWGAIFLMVRLQANRINRRIKQMQT